MVVPTKWYTLSDRIEGWNHKYGKQHELGIPETGVAGLVVRDKDESLNPLNGSSVYNSGGNSLTLYRQIRHWEMANAAGNLICSANDVWARVSGLSGGYADSASFEGGTTGCWSAGGSAISNSAVRAHDGTKSMLVTWPTQTGGGVGSTASISLYGLPVRSGYVYTLSAWVWLVSGPAITLQINGSTATSTSTTGSWQRVVCTFTAVDGDSTMRLFASGSTTAGQQVHVDSVQLEYASSASAFTTSGVTIYPMFWGFIDAYPKTWRWGGFDGVCRLSVIDALGLAARQSSVNDMLLGEILLDSPTWYWPFREPSAAWIPTDTTNYGTSPTTASPYWGFYPTGVNLGSFKPGQTGSPGVDSELYTSFSNAPGTSGSSYGIWNDWAGYNGFSSVLGNAVSPTGSYTVEFWFQTNAVNSASYDMVILGLYGGLVSRGLFKLASGSGQLQYLFYNSSGTLLTTLSGFKCDDGAWHHAALTVTCDGTNITETFYQDGNQVGSASRAGAVPEARWSCFIGYDRFIGTTCYDGRISNFAVYKGVALSSARISQHCQSGNASAYYMELVGVRLRRILALGGWSRYNSINNERGYVAEAAALAGGLQDKTRSTSAGEGGYVYAAPSGELTYLSRLQVYKNVAAGPTLTAGENVAGGEVPYLLDSLAAVLDATYLYDTVTTTSDAAPQGKPGYYASHTTTFINNPLSVKTYAPHPPYLQTMAQDLALRFNTGRVRIDSVTFNLTARPSIAAQLYAVRLGDYVKVARRAPAFTSTVFGVVEGIEFAETPTTGMTCTLQLEAPPPYTPGLIGTGLIGSTAVIAF
jgi:hypothetical protein